MSPPIFIKKQPFKKVSGLDIKSSLTIQESKVKGYFHAKRHEGHSFLSSIKNFHRQKETIALLAKQQTTMKPKISNEF